MTRMTGLSTADAPELEAAADELDASRPKAAWVLRLWARRLAGPARDHLSTTEAAAYLGVTPQTVRNWVDRGWVQASRHHRLGRRQIPLASLDGIAKSRAARRRIVKQHLGDQQIEDLLSGSADDGAQVPRGT